MIFAKRLREGVRRGEAPAASESGPVPTSKSVSGTAWKKVSSRWIRSSQSVFRDITPELARESDFLGVIDLLNVAKHGKGEHVYLIRFHYVPSRSKRRG